METNDLELVLQDETVPPFWMLIMAVFSMAFWVCVIGGIGYGVVKMLGWG